MFLARDLYDQTINPNLPSVDHNGVRAFVALNLSGAIGLLIVLLTAIFNHKVKRLPTWYSFCGSWIFSCISYSLLFLAGEQTTPLPNYKLCFAQAALIYAIPPTTSCTTLALLVQILLSFPDAVSGTPTKTSVRTSCILLMGPYIIFVIMFIGVAMYEVENPLSIDKASRGTYCISTNPAWQRVAFAIVAFVSIIIVIVQAHLAFRLYSNPQVLRRDSHSIATMLRGLLFSLIGAITVISAMVFIVTGSENLSLDLLLAIFPNMALIVFGTQKDLLQAWFFWKVPYYKPEGRGSLFFGQDLIKVPQQS